MTKALFILTSIILLTACGPTKPDGTSYACAAEQWGGACYGTTAEGMYNYNKARLNQAINAHNVGAY